MSICMPFAKWNQEVLQARLVVQDADAYVVMGLCFCLPAMCK